MKKIFRKTLLKQSYISFLDKCHGIILIYGDDNTYEVAKSDELLIGRMPQTGSLSTLYKSIFLKTMSMDSSVDNKYESFTDISLFKQENYHDFITFYHKEENITLEYRILRVSENVFALYFLDRCNNIDSLITSQQKLDTLSEKYLFSMMVDLAKDTCQNSNITELAGKHHDYIDIKYSQWRFMITDMFLPSDKVTFLSISEPDYVIDMLEKKSSYSYEMQMRNLKGDYIWVRLSFSRVTAFSRRNPIFVYTVEDIHEDMLRLLQQQNIISAIEKPKDEIVTFDSDATDFLTAISHEMRTPLTAILGLDELIMRESTDASIISYANDIQNAGKHLLQIVNDFLDYNRLNNGKLALFPESYSVSSMVEDIFSMTSVLAKEKNLSLELEMDSSVPKQLFGDSLRLKQVITNLLSNAIKYTKDGSVTLCLDFEPTDDNQGNLLVKVSDTGDGITQENMDKLFAPYERIDENENKNIPGTGLGMSIVISLLELMNSKLHVESEEVKGSTFSFCVKQSLSDDVPSETTKTVTATPLSLDDKSILVIDDLGTNLTIMKHLLKDTNANVDVASDGTTGLAMLTSNKYDLVFLDVLMPDISGKDILGKLKEMEKPLSDIPVIAMTANISANAKQKYQEIGFHDLLEKPIDIHSLESLLRKYLT